MDVALINEGTYPYVSGGVSAWCDKLVRGLPEHPFHRYPQSVRHNGVEPDSYPEITTEPPVSTISWVGRVDPLKDLETLISAYAIVRARLPDAVLRLFGPTPEDRMPYAAAAPAIELLLSGEAS
jgi:glycosyltransferase involved in cell wall biosynthesis